MNSGNQWTTTDVDREVAAQLQARLPERLFDVHMHVYPSANAEGKPAFLGIGVDDPGIDAWREGLGHQVGERRLVGALCTPIPYGDVASATRKAVHEAETHASCRANMLLTPAMNAEETEAYVLAHDIAGFKPYHVYAARERTFDASLDEYLPAWAWELADRHGLLILLHIVKDDALCDPDNQARIVRNAERYPNARLVLAHAGRAFHADNTVRGIAALRGLQNVYFDNSAICEADALTAILEEFGPQRLMWGSDFPVSQKRGRAISLGTGFAWVVTDEVTWNDKAFFGDPILVGLESLAALLTACDRMGLNDNDLRNIFADNALRLLGLERDSGRRTAERYEQAKAIIPGGTQLLSKRPEMFAPGVWPAYADEARGCEIVDLDGRRYLDLSTHGIGACLLGFRDPDVTRAVQRRLSLGSFCTLNPPEEVELAEALCTIHPWAESVRFARTGGETMTVAVRIARATTDRSLVAVCGYHGWHDWYLAANLGEDDSLRGHLLPGLEPSGVPRELRGTTMTFQYGDREAFERILEEHGDRLAAVVMEPCRHHLPEPDFLEAIREGAHRVGALLVFDEITIGWRLHYGGAHLKLGCNPDIAVFAKSLGNGHPMGAVIGTATAMEGAHESFISSTYWTEGIGPAAALATIRKMRQVDVPKHVTHIGERLKSLWANAGEGHGLPVKVRPGIPVLPGFSFEHEEAPVLGTLFTTFMLEEGFLAKTATHLSIAHTDEIIDRYAAAVDRTFERLAAALKAGDLRSRLKGGVAHSTFQRLL